MSNSSLIHFLHTLFMSSTSFRCAWWDTDQRGWRTEGCTIVDLSMKIGGGLGDRTATGSSSSARRDAVVRCECLMSDKHDKTASFQGSFGVIKENTEEDQAKRLKDKKGDAGSMLGYIFKRIASSFNINNVPFEVIPSAMYICFVPLAVYVTEETKSHVMMLGK